MVEALPNRRADPVEAWLLEHEKGSGGPEGTPGGIARSASTVVALLSAAVGVGVAFRALGLDEANIVLVFLLAVAGVAFLAGRWASIAASGLGVLAFNFFFTQPLHTFAVAELQYVFTLAVMLLDNALKYAPSGAVVVDVVAKPEVVEVSVLDEGQGLPAGDSERLFERFVRGSDALLGGARGSGLGLAICRSIVEAHGGSIRAENRPEGGARFSFVLPLADRMAPVDELEPPHDPGG